MRQAVRRLILGLAAAAAIAGATAAQDQTLGDVRADLGVLDRQIKELRAALVASGSGRGLPTAPATALTRLDQLEGELRRLTSRVEVLTNDIERIAADATNRAGDLEFRLTELEGGDTSLLGPPEPLGGGVAAPAPAVPAPAAPVPGGGELAVSERADFDAAMAAQAAGNNAEAARLFEGFLSTYPGGPLSAEAQFRRGEALGASGEWRGAARSFLDSFSGAPEGPYAPPALLQLGVSLGHIGKTDEACLTLSEVVTRYPGSEAASQAPAQRTVLGCP